MNILLQNLPAVTEEASKLSQYGDFATAAVIITVIGAILAIFFRYVPPMVKKDTTREDAKKHLNDRLTDIENGIKKLESRLSENESKIKNMDLFQIPRILERITELKDEIKKNELQTREQIKDIQDKIDKILILVIKLTGHSDND